MQFDCENIIEAEPVPEVKMNRSADFSLLLPLFMLLSIPSALLLHFLNFHNRPAFF